MYGRAQRCGSFLLAYSTTNSAVIFSLQVTKISLALIQISLSCFFFKIEKSVYEENCYMLCKIERINTVNPKEAIVILPYSNDIHSELPGDWLTASFTCVSTSQPKGRMNLLGA